MLTRGRLLLGLGVLVFSLCLLEPSPWSVLRRNLRPKQADSGTAVLYRTRPGQPLGEDDKYLIFFTHWGLSNQLLSVERAVLLATALNRTLVLPELLNHEGTSYFRYSDLFDLEGLRRDLYSRIIEMPEYISGGGEAPDVLLRPGNGYAGESQWWERLGWEGLTWRQLPVNLTTDMAQYVGELRGNEKRVLGCTSLFYYENDYLSEPGVVARMNKLLRLNPKKQEAVDAAVAQLQVKHQARHGMSGSGSYSCMHLRRGDFKDHCEFLIDVMKKPAYVAKWTQGLSCYPNTTIVARNIREADMAQDLIYVSTDDPTALEDPELRGFHFADSRDVNGVLEPVLEQLRGLVPVGEAKGMMDQAICAAGTTLLLNDYSTFSESVVYRVAGCTDKRVVFLRHFQDV